MRSHFLEFYEVQEFCKEHGMISLVLPCTGGKLCSLIPIWEGVWEAWWVLTDQSETV